LLEIVRNTVPRGVNCIFIRQTEALGLGHAVLCARPVVDEHPFAVLLADDLMDNDEGEPTIMQQMAAVFDERQTSVLAVQDVPRAETKSYGIVGTSDKIGDRLEVITHMVEKPKPENAPSTLAVVGRYILTPRVFYHLARLDPGTGSEIQLTDGISKLLTEEQVLAFRFAGRRYDCGSKIGYLQATVELGLKHAETRAAFAQYLKTRA
jgi:UTP--glucose-1-phosphate uridylyltransferase